MTTPYKTGQIVLTNNSALVTGIDTAWQIALVVGGAIFVEADGNPLPILSVDSNTQITAAVKWKGASGTYNYALVRDSALLEQVSQNATALSQLIVELRAGTLFKYDTVGLLADKAIYDERPKGFSFLAVDQVPFQLYVKRSNASGDWSGPARYAQGEQGQTGAQGPQGIQGPAGPKGADGIGTGDVVGPNGSTDSNVALFDGTTGKTLKGATKAAVVADAIHATTAKPAVADNDEFGFADSASSPTPWLLKKITALALRVYMLVQPLVDIASAATTNIGAAASSNVRITGTAGITSFGVADAGTLRRGVMAGVLTITHSAALNLPNGGANITTAAGDTCEALSLGSGNWVVLRYTRADGTALAGASGIKHGTMVNNPNQAATGWAIPAGVKRITVHFSGVTLSASGALVVRIGAGGVVKNSGYAGVVTGQSGSGAASIASIASTSGVLALHAAIATGNYGGTVVFERMSPTSNLWEFKSIITYNLNAGQGWASGTVDLGGELDRVQITTQEGTPLLNGTFNTTWEL